MMAIKRRKGEGQQSSRASWSQETAEYAKIFTTISRTEPLICEMKNCF